jgi:hypothetical protein
MAIRYKCSDGSHVSQATIRVRYQQSRQEKYSGFTMLLCECCNETPGNDSDHTIAQARCKQIHKTELIWHKGNYVWSCRNCHQEYENFKSGDWMYHRNTIERLLFLKEHDFEGFAVRMRFTPHAIEKFKGLLEN